jgi:hypothetical protein
MKNNDISKPKQARQSRATSSRVQARTPEDASPAAPTAELPAPTPKRTRPAPQQRPARQIPPEERLEAACERLGTRTPQCQGQDCVETDPFALTGTFPDILCAACLAQRTGKLDTERHHAAGQHNLSVTVPIPINEHRILSDRQRDWPEETLKNPKANPLLKAAGALRGWIDILKLVIERCIGWIPAMLESLNTHLIQRLGPSWWEEWDWRCAA